MKAKVVAMIGITMFLVVLVVLLSRNSTQTPTIPNPETNAAPSPVFQPIVPSDSEHTPVRSTRPDPFDQLLDAMIIVESGGDVNAVGDGGDSIGPLQIQLPYWQDAREFAERRAATGDMTHAVVLGGEYNDVVDVDYAKAVVRAWWDRYMTRERLGRQVLPQDLARSHNGGPMGWKRDSTLGYWEKVSREYKRIRLESR